MFCSIVLGLLNFEVTSAIVSSYPQANETSQIKTYKTIIVLWRYECTAIEHCFVIKYLPYHGWEI